MVEKGIGGRICHAIHRYGKPSNKKLPVNNFDKIEDNSQFNKDFIKNYNEENYEG